MPPDDPDFATLPEPPYWAVVFSSRRAADGDDDGYAAMAERMVRLGREQPGFLGIESARDACGFGITVSYWRSEADIAAWKANAEHRLAQDEGQRRWYAHFELRVARVERAYGKARAR
jgi:heme-degrading monooxygenase HmoA